MKYHMRDMKERRAFYITMREFELWSLIVVAIAFGFALGVITCLVAL